MSGVQGRMKLAASLLLAVLPVTAAACAETVASTAPDSLSRLRDVMNDTITNDTQDSEMWALTQQVAAEKKLVGWTRSRVVAALGPGFECNPGIYACPGNLSSGDLIYWVGRLPEHVNGGTPALLIDLDEDDRVIAISAIHTQ